MLDGSRGGIVAVEDRHGEASTSRALADRVRRRLSGSLQVRPNSSTSRTSGRLAERFPALRAWAVRRPTPLGS